jgi:mycothiol system anti-sigma-R factor
MDSSTPDSGYTSDPFDPFGKECQEAIRILYHFLDGELTSEKRAQIQQHLDDCPPCIQAFQFEAELRNVVSRSCQETVPDALRLKVSMLLEQEYREGFGRL